MDTTNDAPHQFERLSPTIENLYYIAEGISEGWTPEIALTSPDTISDLLRAIALGGQDDPTLLRATVLSLAMAISQRLEADAADEEAAWDARPMLSPTPEDDSDPTPPSGLPRPATEPSSANPDQFALVRLPERGSVWFLFQNPELRVRIVEATATSVRYTDARVEGLNRQQRRSLPSDATAEQVQPLLTFLAAATMESQ